MIDKQNTLPGGQVDQRRADMVGYRRAPAVLEKVLAARVAPAVSGKEIAAAAELPQAEQERLCLATRPPLTRGNIFTRDVSAGNLPQQHLQVEGGNAPMLPSGLATLHLQTPMASDAILH